MKRLASIPLCVVIIAVFLSSCRDNKVSTAGIETITPKTLTVCADFPYAPFDLEKDGAYSGIDVDLVNAIGWDLGYKVVFKPTVFDDIFDAMNGKSCDMVASAVSISDERKKSMLFSDGYFEINQSLLVLESSSKAGVNVLSPGHKIGAQAGTTGESYAQSHASGATVVAFDDVEQLYAALKSSAIEGAINDFPVNSYQARQDQTLKVAQTFNDVDREQYGFALPLGATRLQTAVNASLKRILDDGRYDSILGLYLGSATAE